VRGRKRTPKILIGQKFEAKSQKVWAEKFRHFSAILMNLSFFECINESLLCYRKHNKYMQSQQTVVTLCFNM